MKKTVFLLILLLSLTPCIFAKRSAPKEITPIVHRGIKYIVPHWGASLKKKQNGGFIEAFDIKNKKRLWLLRVYKIKYDENLEKDVQDVFITEMKIKNNKLVVRNEKNDTFIIDLKTKKVKPDNKTYSLKKDN